MLNQDILKWFSDTAIQDELQSEMSKLEKNMNGEMSQEDVLPVKQMLLQKYIGIRDDFHGLTKCSMYFMVSTNEMLSGDSVIAAIKAYAKEVDVKIDIVPLCDIQVLNMLKNSRIHVNDPTWQSMDCKTV